MVSAYSGLRALAHPHATLAAGVLGAGCPFGWCSVAAPRGGDGSLVDGTNGENALSAERPTLGEALRLACGQARAVGMLAPAATGAGGRL